MAAFASHHVRLALFPLDVRRRWLQTRVVPRCRKLEADHRLIGPSLQRIADEARDYASIPCVLPYQASSGEAAPNA